MPRNCSKVSILWIEKNRVLGALAVENAALLCQVSDEVAAFHELDLDLDSSLQYLSWRPLVP